MGGGGGQRCNPLTRLPPPASRLPENTGIITLLSSVVFSFCFQLTEIVSTICPFESQKKVISHVFLVSLDVYVYFPLFELCVNLVVI